MTISIVFFVCILAVESFGSYNVFSCNDSRVQNFTFSLSTNGGPTQNPTKGFICHNNGYFVFKYFAGFEKGTMEPYSTFENCNEHLYEMSAVEVFIGVAKNASSSVYEYLEIEISPKNVMFFSNIDNFSNSCANFKGTLRNCDGSGITHSVSMSDDMWAVNVLIPFSILPNGPVVTNMFRIAYVDEQGTKEYQAWNPTLLQPPCFHVPSKFVSLVVV